MTTRFPSTSNENAKNEADASSVAVNMPPGQFLNDYFYKPHKQKLLKQMNFEKLISDLQPYFDVEPSMVINRLKSSFYPTNSMQLIRQICMNSIEFEHQVTTIPKDLYGPLMLVLTLAAILMFRIPSSVTVLEEFSIIGTSLTSSFAYWIASSTFIFILCLFANALVSLSQCAHLVGYSLFPLIITDVIAEIEYNLLENDYLFKFTALIIGVSSALKISTSLVTRSVKKSGNSIPRLLLGTFPVISTLWFSYYIHYQFRVLVEAIEHSL